MSLIIAYLDLCIIVWILGIVVYAAVWFFRTEFGKYTGLCILFLIFYMVFK
jgi:hypothetical protein